MVIGAAITNNKLYGKEITGCPNLDNPFTTPINTGKEIAKVSDSESLT